VTKAKLTHLDKSGAANMVDVGAKVVTERVAVAEGAVTMGADTLRTIRAGDAKKGDVIGTARIAGIMAAKRTHELIPLCHPIGLTGIAVDIAPDDALPGLRVRATAKVAGQTGVEMEALTAASVACLTIYDMAKAIDRGMEIGAIRLDSSRGCCRREDRRDRVRWRDVGRRSRLAAGRSQAPGFGSSPGLCRFS
jgi:cyclic pyranopterin phosphate synthase